MKKAISLVLISFLASCGDDDGGTITPDAQTQAADAAAPDAGLALSTPDQILAWMNGKTFLMEGDNIPSHPNGFNEDQNFGQATQCYQRVTMEAENNNVTVTSDLGTLEDAPNTGDIGTCDHDTANGTLMFTSTTILIENVMNNGECFDFTVTYPGGLVQEGRAKIAPDGSTLTLEIFFANQATGHRCADGAVGSGGITVTGIAFTGNAQQVYEVQ